MISYGKSKPAG